MGKRANTALRTVDVARQSGYSVQQVRDLERLGVLPPAPRAANGYRLYGAVHVHALCAYRGIAGAAGPVEARRLFAEMQAESATVETAAAAVNALHVRLARERDEVLRAQEALRALRVEAGAGKLEQQGRGSGGDVMTITELAGALGVRASTLRFWEQEGLVVPERVTSLRARRYGPSAVGAARIVAALRGAGYGVPAVRDVMGELHRSDGLGATRRILDERLEGITARTVALLRAGADLAVVVQGRP